MLGGGLGKEVLQAEPSQQPSNGAPNGFRFAETKVQAAAQSEGHSPALDLKLAGHEPEALNPKSDASTLNPEP